MTMKSLSRVLAVAVAAPLSPFLADAESTLLNGYNPTSHLPAIHLVAHSKSNGPEPVIKVTNRTSITYYDAPAGFHPKVPDPLPDLLPLWIRVHRESWSGQIRGITVGAFVRGTVWKQPRDFTGRARKLVTEDFDALRRTRHLVLKCTYQDDNERGLPQKLFWWKKVPDKAAPERLRARVRNHPILEFEGAAKQCPHRWN